MLEVDNIGLVQVDEKAERPFLCGAWIITEGTSCEDEDSFGVRTAKESRWKVQIISVGVPVSAILAHCTRYTEFAEARPIIFEQPCVPS